MSASRARRHRPFVFASDPLGVKAALARLDVFYPELAHHLGVSLSHLQHVLSGSKRSLRVETGVRDFVRAATAPAPGDDPAGHDAGAGG